MWWEVYCKGCDDKYVIPINPNYDIEFTCIKIGCNLKLKKVKELEVKQKKDPYENFWNK